MKHLITLLTLLGLFACATTNMGLVNVTEEGVAVKGYDVVAYHLVNIPTEGTAEHSVKYGGGTWYFSSVENKRLFKKNPEKYLPAYGGFCAYGVTQEAKYDIDPVAFKVVDGTLYLNLSPGTQRVWERDIPGNIEKADAIWPTLLEQ